MTPAGRPRPAARRGPAPRPRRPRTRGGSARPTRLSEPRARKQPAQLGEPAVIGRGRPVESCAPPTTASGPVTSSGSPEGPLPSRPLAARGAATAARSRASRRRSRASGPSRATSTRPGPWPRPAGRTPAPARSPRARRGAPATRSRSLPLTIDARRGETGSRRRCAPGQAVRGAASRRRAEPSCSRIRITAAPDDPGRGAALPAVDDVIEHEPRAVGRRPAASAAGPASDGGRSDAGSPNRLLARTTSTRPGRRGPRAPRRGRRGRSPLSRPPASRRCRRRSASAGDAATASRISGSSRLGRRLVYRLPGPITIRSASAIASSASSQARDARRA